MNFRDILKMIALEYQTESGVESDWEVIHALLRESIPNQHTGTKTLPALSARSEYRYLIFDEIPHMPRASVQFLDSLREVECWLVGTMGVLNPFTGVVVVIEELRPKRFEIEYEDAAGEKYVFAKDRHKSFDAVFLNPTVVWSK